MKPVIKIKRVYDPALKEDGYRILVDRLWPRGLKKPAVKMDEWIKELAPTTALRKWFAHDPERWTEFQVRYKAEINNNEAIQNFLAAHEDKKVVTLLYGAKDEIHNHALVLQEYLAELLSKDR